MTLRAAVRGVGHYLPDRVVPNAEFEAIVETSDEWIRSRSGIERRHFAADGQTTSDLATRAAPHGLSNRQLGALGFAMLATAGAILLAVSGGARMPTGLGLAHLAGGTVFGMAGYHALTHAMRTGEVSAVTPFRYTRLVFALVLAMALFGERPDLATWIGAGLVVGSGLFALTRR